MFVIQTSKGVVAGFSRSHGLVSWAGNLDYAKKFKTMAAASSWAAKHSDCGYGLSSEGQIIVQDFQACFAPAWRSYHQLWNEQEQRWGEEDLLGYHGSQEQGHEFLLAHIEKLGYKLRPESNLSLCQTHLWDCEPL